MHNLKNNCYDIIVTFSAVREFVKLRNTSVLTRERLLQPAIDSYVWEKAAPVFVLPNPKISFCRNWNHCCRRKMYYIAEHVSSDLERIAPNASDGYALEAAAPVRKPEIPKIAVLMHLRLPLPSENAAHRGTREF